MNVYVGLRIYQWLVFYFPNIKRLVFATLYFLVAFSFIFVRLPINLPTIIKNTLNLIGAYWMGAFIYFMIFFVLADALLLIGNVAKLIPPHMLKNARFYAGAAVMVFTIGAVLYGLYNARQIKIVSYDLNLNKELNKSLTNKMNIVLISDLHLGDINSEKHLEGIVRAINNLTPDIVCIAGDIFNDNFYNIRNPDRASDLLNSINTPFGVYASLGNHDGGSTLNEMAEFLKSSGIKLLNDEYVIIDERLILIGRLDSSPIGGFGEMKRKCFSEIYANIKADLPIAVMDHNPTNINEYGSEVDLILSGHTHRGQLFPGGLITRMMFTVDYGHYQKDSESPHVIVSQGVHTWMMPMRVGTNNEIVSILIN